ncbi:MAG TPA: PepSY domain-containing protein [Steroidobacteraceae bacterium]|nr:PepSY domain-containing protein [Steroidobacteraceae bacterium]
MPTARLRIRQWPDHRTVWRWHFYAGVLCIPFVLWLAATGSVYLFKPQIDAWLDRPCDNLTVDGPPASASAQVGAALAAVPGAVLNAYELPGTAHSAARVLLGRGERLTRVYVHPVTLQVLRVVDEDSRFSNLIFHLHGELMQGDRGSMVVETAASWTIVMLITGLYLWWPKDSRGIAGVLYPRLSRRGRLFWRDTHTVTGFWVSFFALFLLISGLPWARSWGGMLESLRHWSSAVPIKQDWTTGASSELAERRLANAAPDTAHRSAEHAAHQRNTGPDAPEGAPQLLEHDPDYRQLDGLVPVVRAESLKPPVLIAPPSRREPGWTARSETQNRPQRAELTLDGARALVVSRRDFSQRPWLDRVIGIAIAAHEGQLFAPLNQALGLFTAASLWLVSISAIVMWWRRRPARVLGAPEPAARPALAIGMLAIVIFLSVLLPLMGATLLAVLALERIVLRRWPAAREFLGLPAAAARSTPV